MQNSFGFHKNIFHKIYFRTEYFDVYMYLRILRLPEETKKFHAVK